MKQAEKRFESFEFRADDKKEMTVSGYAALFNRKTTIETMIGSFDEEIAPGAFSSSISGGDVRALWSHNTDIVIGRTKNGSLKLSEDERGLKFELTLPNTTAGRDAYELIKRGDVSGVSFGFRVKAEEWQHGENDKPDTRRLLDVELLEISPVAFPAYEATSVSARASEEALKEAQTRWAHDQRHLEKLRESLDMRDRRFKLSRFRGPGYIH